MLRIGDLVITHRNRAMPVMEIMGHESKGEMLELEMNTIDKPLLMAPGQIVANVAPELPSVHTQTITARYLRRNQTDAERILWPHLRSRRLGTRFRRQHPIGSFIIDFFAPQVRLAIEVDGTIHNQAEQHDYDQFRQDLIEQADVEFLRFRNEEIKGTPTLTADCIESKVIERLSRFDHRVKWVLAGEVQAGMLLFAEGQSEIHRVNSVRLSIASEELFTLRVTEDHSFVTQACTVKSI
jgi:very-short-patch-repair endonuclease